jgi:uncharacterized protein YbaR (Trm112 family)
MIRKDLLEILVCPESHQSLREMNAEEVAALNRRIEGGDVKNRGGQVVKGALQGALLRQDGRFAYPVLNDLPIMLIDEAIPMEAP